MSFKSYKEYSKQNWGSSDGDSLTIEQINTGAILRIADATEKMASNYIQLQNDLKFYKERAEDRYKEIQRLKRSNASLRGRLKRLKSKP